MIHGEIRRFRGGNDDIAASQSLSICANTNARNAGLVKHVQLIHRRLRWSGARHITRGSFDREIRARAHRCERLIQTARSLTEIRLEGVLSLIHCLPRPCSTRSPVMGSQ